MNIVSIYKSNVLTMSSREIAEITDKRHDNVMADIRKMLVELHGEDRLLSFQETVDRQNSSGGAPIKSVVFSLPKRDSLIVVAQLCPEFTAAHGLESKGDAA